MKMTAGEMVKCFLDLEKKTYRKCSQKYCSLFNYFPFKYGLKWLYKIDANILKNFPRL